MSERDYLEKLRVGEDNIKFYNREIRWEDLHLIFMA
jgi:hypothetical protein